jgi:hypothetical protein
MRSCSAARAHMCAATQERRACSSKTDSHAWMDAFTPTTPHLNHFSTLQSHQLVQHLVACQAQLHLHAENTERLQPSLGRLNKLQAMLVAGAQRFGRQLRRRRCSSCQQHTLTASTCPTNMCGNICGRIPQHVHVLPALGHTFLYGHRPYNNPCRTYVRPAPLHPNRFTTKTLYTATCSTPKTIDRLSNTFKRVSTLYAPRHLCYSTSQPQCAS